MTPKEIIEAAINEDLSDQDGNVIAIELAPPLNEPEIEAFAASLPCKLPEDIRELLRFCTGFTGVIDRVDFTGAGMAFAFEEIFPYGLPIASDGFGNFWLVDLWPGSTKWGPIYFCCHDAPIVLYQSDNLEHFVNELFNMYTPPYESDVDEVHDDRIYKVWRENPGVLEYRECLESPDPVLSSFAKELNETYQVIDLRNGIVGYGFSWGRYGAETVNKRYGSLPVFAYQKKSSFLKRFFK